MAGMGPSWFAADQVFEGHGGWYVGSRDGFSIGPYDTMAAAEAEVAELRRRLPDAGNAGVREILGVVCGLIGNRQEDSARRRSYGRMQPARSGELPRLGYRSPRFFAMYGKWYFLTREGIDVGPYASKQAADRDQQRLVALLRRCETDQQRRSAILDFMTAPVGGGL